MLCRGCGKKRLSASCFRLERYRSFLFTIIYLAQCTRCDCRRVAYYHIDENLRRRPETGTYPDDRDIRPELLAAIDSGEAREILKPQKAKVSEEAGPVAMGEWSMRARDPQYALKIQATIDRGYVAPEVREE